MFHCRMSIIYIHIEDVCGGYKDCPHSDDEIMCELRNIKCPEMCTCLNFAIICNSNLTFVNNMVILPFVFVSISHGSLSSLNILSMFDHAFLIKVTHNRISNICGILSGNDSVEMIKLSNNMIVNLTHHYLYNITKLKTLYLDNNLLETIHIKALTKIPQLHLSNLSCNHLNYLPNALFQNLQTLEVISITNNPLFLIKLTTFDSTVLQLIESDDYRVCCIASSCTKCNALRPWYIDCSNLLPSESMTITLAFVSACIFILNVLSLLFHLCLRRHRYSEVFKFIIIKINISDMLCFLFLLILVIADLCYQGSSVTKTMVWKQSTFCHGIFVISLSFALVSPLVISFLSLSRLIVVIPPLNAVLKNKRFSIKWHTILIFCGMWSFFRCNLQV